MGLYQVSTVTMPISSKITETFVNKNGTLSGVWIPVVTSTANVFVQVSPDPSSANFVRARIPPPNSGDFTISTGAGSFAVSLVDLTLYAPFVRLESLVFETASRAYVLMSKM